MNYIHSLWTSTANEIRKVKKLSGTVDTDVVIIGGGFTGLATSYYLKKKNIDVVILEKNRVGWGASGRNAGMLLTGYKKPMTLIANEKGLETAKELMDISLDGISSVKEIVEENNIDCSLKNCGSLTAAYKQKHFEELKKDHELLYNKLDYETQIVTKESLNKELDSQLYFGGLIDSHAYSFHPLNYALGLAKTVEKLGGNIFEESPALSVEYENSRITVNTPGGKVFAKNIVYALNGYITKDICSKLYKCVVPVGSYIIATEPLSPQHIKTLIPSKKNVSDTKNYLYYFRVTPDNRMLFGGRVSFGKEKDAIYTKLRKNMLEVFPQLENYKISYKWGGLVGLTMDFYPQIGELNHNSYFAFGYCGHGASLSTLMGKLIAQNIVDKNSGKTQLEKLPIKRIPFHDQVLKLLSIAGVYYKLKDLVS